MHGDADPAPQGASRRGCRGPVGRQPRRGYRCCSAVGPRIPRIGSGVVTAMYNASRALLASSPLWEAVAIRHISQAVTDVLSGAGDPEGDGVVEKKNPQPV